MSNCNENITDGGRVEDMGKHFQQPVFLVECLVLPLNRYLDTSVPLTRKTSESYDTIGGA